jgi:membrane carboxypeptidase/penicillin-binding protein
MVAAWFVGYTKQITTSVMYVKGKQGTDDLGSRFYGGTWPLSTWLDYMHTAMDGKDRLSFDPPSNRPATKSPVVKHTPKPTATATETPTPTATDSPTTEPTTAPPTTEPSTEPTKSTVPKPTGSDTKAP